MTQSIFPGTPLLAGPDVELKRRQILDYFHATFDRYEQLFEVLTATRRITSSRSPCVTRCFSTSAIPPPFSSTSWCWPA